MTTYSFQRGETISLALDCVTGSTADVDTIVAAMQRSVGGTPVPFTVTERAAAGQIPAGWDLTIDAPTSAGLTPGTYSADAAVTVAGGRIVTDPVSVKIERSVSGA